MSNTKVSFLFLGKIWQFSWALSKSTRVLEVGVPAKIECLILAGYPEPTVKWTKSGNIVDSDHKTDLVFENPTKETKGTYTVEVSFYKLTNEDVG